MRWFFCSGTIFIEFLCPTSQNGESHLGRCLISEVLVLQSRSYLSFWHLVFSCSFGRVLGSSCFILFIYDLLRVEIKREFVLDSCRWVSWIGSKSPFCSEIFGFCSFGLLECRCRFHPIILLLGQMFRS